MPVACSACGRSSLRAKSLLWCCHSCQSARVYPLPPPDLLARIYDDGYFADGHCARGYFDLERVRRWKRQSAIVLLSRIANYLPCRPWPLRVLDFGAGTGEFARVCLQRGMQVVAVEPIAHGRNFLAEQGIVAAKQLKEIAAEERFDLIALTDVIEHVRDPVAELCRLRDRLATQGLLVLTTPDYGSWYRKLLGSRWPHLKPTEHLHYFSRQGQRELLSRAGLRWHRIYAHRKVIALDYVLRDQARRGGRASPVFRLAARVARVALPWPVSAYLGEMLVVARRCSR